MKKICSKCGVQKEVTEFYIGRNQCKPCFSKKKEVYRAEHKEEIKKKRREDYYENHEVEKERSSAWKKRNPEKVSEYNRGYRVGYEKNRRKNDPLYDVSRTVRNLIKCSIYHKGYTKKSRTFEILGCTFEEFKIRIESQWEDWMRWDNHGLYNGKENYGWDFDHIVPLSSAQCEEDIYRLNHYSNIQPLCSYVNRCVKRDIIDWVL